MATVQATLKNPMGLHARPAAQVVKLASQFKSDVTVEWEGQQVNGKSILGLLMLAAPEGSVFKIEAKGEDEETAVQALKELIEGF